MDPSITLPEALRGEEYKDKSFCQKCQQPGHWTYKCPNERVYKARPSRTQLLEESTRKNRKRGGQDEIKHRREVEMPQDPMPIEKIQIETDLLNYRMKFRKQLLKERKEKKRAEKLEAKKAVCKDESQLSTESPLSSSSSSYSSRSSSSASSGSSSLSSSSRSSSSSSSSYSSSSPSESSDSSSGSEHSHRRRHPQKKRVRHDSP